MHRLEEGGGPSSILSVPWPGGNYWEDPESILEAVVLCPLCIKDTEHVLARNGSFPRWIPPPQGPPNERRLSKIFRKRCSRCRVTFSLLPDFIVKGHRYRCVLIVDRLWDCLNGASCRSREFLERNSIPYVTDEPSDLPQTCWSDLLDDVRTQPGYQLQARWVTRFSARALAAVPRLMVACIAVGHDLRDYAWSFSDLTLAPAQSWALALALFLWSALRGQPGPCKTELELLVRYLLADPPAGPSHNRRRAPGLAPSYDGRAVPGRSPPPGRVSQEVQDDTARV